jgi:hypothetical protein
MGTLDHTNTYFLLYLAQFFLEWEMFQTKVTGKSKHSLSSVTFFLEVVSFLDNVDKFCRVEQVTDDNMTHAHCLLDT